LVFKGAGFLLGLSLECGGSPPLLQFHVCSSLNNKAQNNVSHSAQNKVCRSERSEESLFDLMTDDQSRLP
jgi:hypothetical protein